MKSVIIRFGLCKSPIFTLHLYFFGILEFQGIGNLVSLRLSDLIKIPQYSYLIMVNLFTKDLPTRAVEKYYTIKKLTSKLQ